MRCDGRSIERLAASVARCKCRGGEGRGGQGFNSCRCCMQAGATRSVTSGRHAAALKPVDRGQEHKAVRDGKLKTREGRGRTSSATKWSSTRGDTSCVPKQRTRRPSSSQAAQDGRWRTRERRRKRKRKRKKYLVDDVGGVRSNLGSRDRPCGIRYPSRLYLGGMVR